ncbi:hypothetical protein KQX54_016476 [Cotesia glomerata]|uniref:Uncharacterized protein n=1 Tax=Cotesia glomerata TaxID=32391 RepID=A0AAV7I6J2_COTGL|nr:hypothetical protein KQX54_016476 [Cotesia glomerata]
MNWSSSSPAMTRAQAPDGPSVAICHSTGDAQIHSGLVFNTLGQWTRLTRGVEIEDDDHHQFRRATTREKNSTTKLEDFRAFQARKKRKVLRIACPGQ